MGRPTSFRRGLGTPLVVLSIAFIVGIVAFFFVGRCAPTSFARGEPIALGAFRLTVLSAEALAAGDKDLELSIFLQWVQVDSAERKWWMWPWVGSHRMARGPKLTLMDSTGNKYRRDLRGPGATPREEIPGDRVVSFTVPRKSRGFTLTIENPEPREGQPCAAVVSLGH